MPTHKPPPPPWGGPPPAAGPPKLPPEEKATPPARARITFDLAPEEAALLDAKAAARGMTRSAYIRALVLAALGIAAPAVKGRRPRQKAPATPATQPQG